MRFFNFGIRILLVTAFLALMGCGAGLGTGSIPGSDAGNPQGIEVGNPDLTGKKITVAAAFYNPIFVVRFDAEGATRITRILSGIYETQGSSNDIEGLTAILRAFFEDGAEVEIELVFNNLIQVLEAFLHVNGLELENEFLEEVPPFACERPEPNAAEALAQGLCSRLVGCGLQAACDSCEGALLDLPGLGNVFGTPPGMTLGQSAQGLEEGSLEVDPEALALCQSDMEVIPCALLIQGLSDNPDNLNPVKGLIPKPSCAKGVLKAKK